MLCDRHGASRPHAPVLILALAVLMAVMFSRPLPAVAAVERPAFSASVSLPFGGQVRPETAELTARTLARLQVLHQAERTLAGLTVVRFGLDERHLTALADDVLLSILTVSTDEAARTVTVRADIFVPLAALPDAAQAALQRPDDLELQAEALGRAEALAGEAVELIRRAAAERERGQPDDPFSSRLSYLESQLRATTRYMALLSRYGSDWLPPEEAVDALRVILRRDPDNALINLGLAEALLRLDQPHEASRLASTALSLEPELARALYVRGLAQLRLRLSALAVADFTQALALRPDKPSWWRARGAAYLIRHEYLQMCADLYQACTLGDCAGLAEVRGQELCIEDGAETGAERGR